jgi:hypothetical protein
VTDSFSEVKNDFEMIEEPIMAEQSYTGAFQCGGEADRD